MNDALLYMLAALPICCAVFTACLVLLGARYCEEVSFSDALKAPMREIEEERKALYGALTESTNHDLAGALMESQAGQLTEKSS